VKIQGGRISVYPNPSTGKFTLSSDNNLSGIEVFNMSGKRIYSDFILAKASKEVDLSKYPKGIYFIKVYKGTKSYNRKVVIQ
jgi:hypothetical protein